MAANSINGLGLCAGGLGLELGLDIALPGYRTVGVVEREVSVCGRVAARIREGSLPQFAIWSDVATFDGKPWRGVVDIVSAGFPCQPFSVAGKRKGTSDERWIWPDIARIIGEIEPQFCFLENVPGLLLDPDSDSDRWAVDEQPDDSLGGMGTVLRDLAGLGFDAEWLCLRASDVGASHGRKRVFILAHRHGARCRWDAGEYNGGPPPLPPRSGERHGRMANSEYTRSSSARSETRCEAAPDNALRPDGPLGNPECAEWGASSPGSGRDRTGIDGQGKKASRARDGEPVLADPASEGFSLGRDDSGLRELSALERTGGELGDSPGGGLRIVRESPGGLGQPDGAECALENSARDGEHGLDRQAGRLRRRGICTPGEQLGAGVGIFAFGPADIRWQDLLVSRPWLRPSWSQAEAESYFRDLVDGLASLVAADRTGALRTLGNGVVPLQAAAAFVELARRCGLLGRRILAKLGERGEGSSS